jgi:hypothetical protein
MLASKSAYFDFLAALDRKVQNGGQRSLAEIAHLESRLQAHTDAVGHFRTTMVALAAADRSARDALVTLIGELNRELGAETNTRAH